MNAKVKCSKCRGYGREVSRRKPVLLTRECRSCKGSGRVWVELTAHEVLSGGDVAVASPAESRGGQYFQKLAAAVAILLLAGSSVTLAQTVEIHPQFTMPAVAEVSSPGFLLSHPFAAWGIYTLTIWFCGFMVGRRGSTEVWYWKRRYRQAEALNSPLMRGSRKPFSNGNVNLRDRNGHIVATVNRTLAPWNRSQ